jgi:hypothetical protein
MYWGHHIEEDRTDGASGMNEIKNIFIKGLGSKNAKEPDHV